MTQEIDSKRLLIRDVFDKWYRLPEYQRPYVWETEQVTELLEDIYQASQSNRESQYFLGSMVLKRNRKEYRELKYEEFDLLDGQQRLTTLLLMMAVVRDLTPRENEARLKTCKESIFRMANPDDNVPERLRVIFDIRDKVKEFISKYVKEDGGTDKVSELRMLVDKREEDISIKNMANAILVIRDYFRNGVPLDDFFPYLRSNVLMIYVAADNLEDAFRLFTVMNSRGVKLRNSDILKASNLAKVEDDLERTNCAAKWQEIENYFGDDFDNFLSHLRTILVKTKAHYNLLREYEENIYAPKEFDRNTKIYTPKRPLLNKGKETFDFVTKYFDHYNALVENDHYTITNSYELCNRITMMRKGLEADYWMAALLRYYNKFNIDNLGEFLRLLDNKFSADWIVGLSPTTRIENVNGIIKDIDESQNSSDVISSDNLNIPRDDFVRIVCGGVYGRRYARYILLKIDMEYHGHTTKFSPAETISIEHILPQNPKETSRWVNDFDDLQRATWPDRIGNLILLSRRKNTSLGNLDYNDKRRKYFEKNIELFSNSVRIYNTYKTWTFDDLRGNHMEVLNKLFSTYNFSLSEDELSNI